MGELSDKKMIFVTIASKDGRDDSEIRKAWERALNGVVSPGLEKIEKVTVLPAAPSKQEERKLPETKSTRRISLIVREEEQPPPKFYYSLDDKQWWEVPGELIKVWQLRFMPRDIGVAEGVVKVRGEMGDERVQGLIHIKSAQKHVLELVER